MAAEKKQDARDAFMTKHAVGVKDLPAKAIDDIRYFSKKWQDTGQALSVAALIAWIKDNYGVTIGRDRLRSIAMKHDIAVWWRA